MRTSKKIDYDADPIADDQTMIRLLCSPLYYDKDTHIVSAEAFNLRMLGKNLTDPEPYASLGWKDCLEKEKELEAYLTLGYKIWDDKDWQTNDYAGYATFLAGSAKAVNPDRIEIHHVIGGSKSHLGLFYVESAEEYFRGPLPKDNPEILEMLNDLALLVSESVKEAPARNKIDL